MDSRKDELLTLAEVRNAVPLRNKRAISPPTLRRWISTGVRGVRLESELVGGRRMVSRKALEQFFAKINNGEAIPGCRSAIAQDRLKRYDI